MNRDTPYMQLFTRLFLEKINKYERGKKNKRQKKKKVVRKANL